MVQNLALPGGTTYAGTYSNFPSGGSTFTLPISSTTWDEDNTTKKVYNGTHIGQGDSDGNGIIITSPQKDNTTDNLGAHYSFNAAAAINTKIGTTDEDNDQTTKYYNTLYSICPRNWRLPSSVTSNGDTTPGGDFGELTDGYITAFNTYYYDALTDSTNFALFQNGYTTLCNSNGCPTSTLGKEATWWSATVNSSTGARSLTVFNSSSYGIKAASPYRRQGNSIRCVVGGLWRRGSTPQAHLQL